MLITYVASNLRTWWFISIGPSQYYWGGDVFQKFRFFDFYVRVVHLAQKECGSYSEINRVGYRRLSTKLEIGSSQSWREKKKDFTYLNLCLNIYM